MRGEILKQRLAAGHDLRGELPLESHADLPPMHGRPEPVATLRRQDAFRLQPLVPIRHERMNASPFTFYRGAAAIMASDLSRLPTVGIEVQACGDAHLSNFGVFKGPDRRLLFDINDFDETLPGPFEWDLKRLAASVAIAGRNNDLTSPQIAAAARASVRGYRTAMARAMMLSPLEVHYFRVDVQSLIAQSGEKLRKRSQRTVEKAMRKDSMRALKKLTTIENGRLRIVEKPPLITRLDDKFDDTTHSNVQSFFDRYRATLPAHRAAVIARYKVVDIAHKVVGVGSVGTRCLIVLLQSDLGQPLFLQFKEATASVLAPYCGASEYDEAGERVVRGQRLLQSAGDILLGWSRYQHEDGAISDFYFRQMWDGKGSAEVDQMGPKRLKNYAEHCGATLAMAHARTGDAAAIAGYLGDDATADHAFTEFARSYADLNESDHAAHTNAITSGEVPTPLAD